MPVIVKLLIAALFSIHQYIPDEDTRYKKYFSDVREADVEDVIPAAHEACKYMISVFAQAGVETVTGSSGGVLSSSIATLIADDETLNSGLDVLSSGDFAEKFKEHQINPEDVKTAIKNICSTKFSPLSFSPIQRKEVFDFIQSEIKVLSDVHLNSLGDFNYFGSANIFDRSGEQIGTLDAVPRAWVPYEKLSTHLSLALLATEDEDFFKHRGVDSKAIARIVKQMMSGDDATGGSTVTMQLLKNMYFLNGPASQYLELNTGTFAMVLRKVREWYWAWPFEKEHAKVMGDLDAKKYVLEMYFNLVDFGTRIQGIEQASFVYFGKKASDLDLADAAYITALLKAPSRYPNPDNYVEYTLPRRNDYILTRAEKICLENSSEKVLSTYTEALKKTYQRICTDGKKKIDSEYVDIEKAKPLPLWVRPVPAPTTASMALVKNQISQWINRNKLDPEKKPKEISIQTTIDKKLQDLVFQIVNKRIDGYDSDRIPNVGSINPANDDTGRQAVFRDTDINLRLSSKISTILNKNTDQTKKYFYSVKFRPKNEITSQTLNFALIAQYLAENAVAQEQLSGILENVANGLKDKSKKMGEIYLVEFQGLEFNVLSIEDFVNDKLKISVEEKKSFLDLVQRIQIRDDIIKSSLERMYRNRPRSYMSVGVIGESGHLIDSSLKQVSLLEAHKARAERFKFGDFFWLSPQNIDSGTGPYKLDKAKLQASVMVMDSNTGEVLANYGGYDPLASSFNRSTTGLRQAGSTLKPWIYYLALNKGFNPQDTLNNKSIAFEVPGTNQIYRPGNYSSTYNGPVSFLFSLTQSLNIGTYSLIQNPTWGPDWQQNLDELKAFLIEIELYSNFNQGIPIMLGSQELTLEKLASSFSFFANGTHIVKPQYIKYVTDYKGNKLFNIEPQFVTVPNYRAGTIFQIQTLLAEIANSGTAARMNAFVRELSGGKYKQTCYNDVIGSNRQSCFGGKTGTSNDFKDAWFIGFSKNFVIGVWVGYDDPTSIGGSATGGALALPVFQDIITEGQDLLPPIEPFIENSKMPRNLEKRLVNARYGCNQSSTKDAVLIFTEIGSRQGNCSSSAVARDNRSTTKVSTTRQSSQSTNSQTPRAEQPAQQTRRSALNSCSCVAKRNGQTSLDVVFDGVEYPDFVVYSSEAACNSQKGTIVSQQGRKVCP